MSVTPTFKTSWLFLVRDNTTDAVVLCIGPCSQFELVQTLKKLKVKEGGAFDPYYVTAQ